LSTATNAGSGTASGAHLQSLPLNQFPQFFRANLAANQPAGQTSGVAVVKCIDERAKLTVEPIQALRLESVPSDRPTVAEACDKVFPAAPIAGAVRHN
jgi:hypothetical protein